jgi:hypothetical protein
MTEAIARFMIVGLGFGFRLDSRQAHGALGGEPPRRNGGRSMCPLRATT